MKNNLIKITALKATIIFTHVSVNAGIVLPPSDPWTQQLRCEALSEENRGPRLADVIDGEAVLGEEAMAQVIAYNTRQSSLIMIRMDFLDRMIDVDESKRGYPIYDSPFVVIGVDTIVDENDELTSSIILNSHKQKDSSYRTQIIENNNAIEFRHESNGLLRARLRAKLSYQFHQKELKTKDIDIVLNCSVGEGLN